MPVKDKWGRAGEGRERLQILSDSFERRAGAGLGRKLSAAARRCLGGLPASPSKAACWRSPAVGGTPRHSTNAWWTEVWQRGGPWGVNTVWAFATRIWESWTADGRNCVKPSLNTALSLGLCMCAVSAYLMKKLCLGISGSRPEFPFHTLKP